MKQRLSPTTVMNHQEAEHSSCPTILSPLTESQKNILLENQKKKKSMLPDLLIKTNKTNKANVQRSRANPYMRKHQMTEEGKQMQASQALRQAFMTDYSLQTTSTNRNEATASETTRTRKDNIHQSIKVLSSKAESSGPVPSPTSFQLNSLASETTGDKPPLDVYSLDRANRTISTDLNFDDHPEMHLSRQIVPQSSTMASEYQQRQVVLDQLDQDTRDFWCQKPCISPMTNTHNRSYIQPYQVKNPRQQSTDIFAVKQMAKDDDRRSQMFATLKAKNTSKRRRAANHSVQAPHDYATLQTFDSLSNTDSINKAMLSSSVNLKYFTKHDSKYLHGQSPFSLAPKLRENPKEDQGDTICYKLIGDLPKKLAATRYSSLGFNSTHLALHDSSSRHIGNLISQSSLKKSGSKVPSGGKGDYALNTDYTPFGTSELKKQDTVERRSFLRKMHQVDSLQSNRLLHNDSIMSKFSERQLSPTLMTDAQRLMASESMPFKQKQSKLDSMNVTNELHNENRMQDLRKKIAKRVDLVNEDQKLKKKRVFDSEAQLHVHQAMTYKPTGTSRRSLLKLLTEGKRKFEDIEHTLEVANKDPVALPESPYKAAPSPKTNQKTVSERLKMGICAIDTSSKSLKDIETQKGTGPASDQPPMQAIKDKSPKQVQKKRRIRSNAIGKSFTFGPRKVYCEDPRGLSPEPFTFQPEEMDGDEYTQEVRDYAKLMRYGIMEFEENAMLDEKDQEKLRQKLQCYMNKSQLTRKWAPPINQKYVARKPQKPLEDEHASEQQRLARETAATFTNSDGSLMTNRAVQEMLEKAEHENKIMVAANQPVYGSVSYERAADSILQKDEYKQDVIGEETADEYNLRKGLALLLRKQKGETQEEEQCNELMGKIREYVRALEYGTIDVRDHDGGDFERLADSFGRMNLRPQRIQIIKESIDSINHQLSRTLARQDGSRKPRMWQRQNNQKSIEFEATPQPTSKLGLKYLSKSGKQPKTPGLRGLKRGIQTVEIDHSFTSKLTSVNPKRQVDEKKEVITTESRPASPSAYGMQHDINAGGPLSKAGTRRISIQKSDLGSIRSQAIKRDMLMRKMTNPLQFFKDAFKEDQFDFQPVVDRMIDLVNYNRIAKHWASQAQRNHFEDDHRLRYFLETMNAVELALPLLQRIQNGTLCLSEVKVQPGMAKGIGVACSVSEDILNQIYLDNNGLGDEDLAKILDGANELYVLKQFVLKRNEFGIESLKRTADLLTRFFPSNLQELRIEKCKIAKDVTLSLMHELKKNCFVKRLALVAVNFDEESIAAFCEYLSNSRYLEDLDLSSNQLSPKQMLPILEILSNNMRLKSCSLSWNFLVQMKKPPQASTYVEEERLELEKKVKVEEVRNDKKKSMAKGAQAVGRSDSPDSKTQPPEQLEFQVVRVEPPSPRKKKDMTEMERSVASYLQKFISNSQNLIHLDLSDTGLTAKMLKRIGQAINSSASLLSIHLSGNPGVTREHTEKLRSTIAATYETALSHQTFSQFLPDGAQHKEDKQVNYSQLFHLKQLNQQKMTEMPFEDGSLSNKNSRNLIFTRIIGHTMDMPGFSEWHMHTEHSKECWVCDRKIYTFFFWSPTFAEIESQKIALTPKEEEIIRNKIFMNRETNLERQANRTTADERLATPVKTKTQFDQTMKSEIKIDSEDISEDLSAHDSDNLLTESGLNSSASYGSFSTPREKNMLYQPDRYNISGPTILGAFNNWQQQPMVKVDKLARAIDTNPTPDIIAELKKMKNEEGLPLCRPEVTCKADMTRRERKHHDQREKWHEESYGRPDVWGRRVYRFFKYKDTKVVGAENFTELRPEQIWVAGAFLDMGKNNYIVKYNNRLHMHETFVEFRKEEIPITLKDETKVKLKERSPNVFTHWATVNQETVNTNAAESDFMWWKVSWKADGSYNLIKTKSAYDMTCDVIRKHYDHLKDVFLTLAVNSNYPYIKIADFLQFCQVTKVNDSRLTRHEIEVQFETASFHAKDVPIPKNQVMKGEINRYEFMEVLVRLACCKYGSGMNKVSVDLALERLIEDDIIPHWGNGPWHSFREEELWKRECQLVLEANLEALREVYDMYASQSKMKKFSLSDAIQLLAIDAELSCHPKDAVYCFGMSLHTCQDLIKLTNNRMLHATFEEFLEMIGRAAQIHFQETSQESLHLSNKIEIILEKVLKLVDEVPKQPNPYDLQSEIASEEESSVQAAPFKRLNVITEHRYDEVYEEDTFN